MRRSMIVLLVLALGVLPLMAGEEMAEAEGELDGKALYVEVGKCNMCHAVPAAGIEAKAKSEKMKGPDIKSLPEGVELANLMEYLRKAAPLNDVTHKKEFKGSDEELQAIIDWLGTLEAQE